MTGSTRQTLAAPPTSTAAPGLMPWPQLLATALVGTDRRAGGDSPAAVLDQAAVWSVARRAGRVPVRGIDPPPAAPTETHQLVSRQAAGRLAYLLEAGPTLFEPGLRNALLGEWLTLAATHRRIAPPEYLPDLLELGRQDRGLRPLIAKAGGERAAWLARHNPDWAYAGFGPYRDPAEARTRLGRDWDELPGAERADLISLLGEGLRSDDEEILERALDDRRAEVRATAAKLLTRIPTSDLNRRMLARFRNCLRVDDGRLVVTPPAAFDAGMRRDGLTASPPHGGGVRGWWLEEIVAHTPLAAVTELSPAEFVALPAPPEWRDSVQRGLARAAASQRDGAWAAALLDAQQSGERAGPDDLATSLYAVLDPTELVRRAARAIAEEPANAWVSLLQRCPGPWPDELARLALAALERLPGAPGRTARTGAEEVRAARQLLRDLDRLCDHTALALPPALAAETAGLAQRAASSDLPELYVDSLDRLATIMEFRQRMSLEFSTSQEFSTSLESPT
ncbi:MAG TPA: DUF5691 domain-containing protein, partial [Micromonosporaceae bacterium]|nr:DUF5691 domain-containing protein [Micromonosporaceae bacterium]